MIETIVISVLGILVVVLGFTTLNLLRKNEKQEDILAGYITYLDQFSRIIEISDEKLKKIDGRPCMDIDDLKNAEKAPIPPGSGIILATGYGKNWFSDDYVARCPFLSKPAMDYLIDKKPFIVVFDTPAGENDVHPENIFERYFKANILSVTACINLEKISKYNVKLIVMPLNLKRVSLASPARAVVIED